jgi:hypothetical protein
MWMTGRTDKVSEDDWDLAPWGSSFATRVRGAPSERCLTPASGAN